MTDAVGPEDAPLSRSAKIHLSEFAATLVIVASQQNGVPVPGRGPDDQPDAMRPGSRRKYIEFLIREAVKAGLGSNPNAHAFLAHELDYFSGRPRILGFESDPGAESESSH